MSLTIQKGFWQDSILANTRTKLAELYYAEPEIAKSEKQCILGYWAKYERLEAILGEKWDEFKDWFTKATSLETITRCLRSLKETKTIDVTPEDEGQRREQESGWCRYWGNEKHLRGGDGSE